MASDKSRLWVRRKGMGRMLLLDAAIFADYPAYMCVCVETIIMSRTSMAVPSGLHVHVA